MNRIIEYIENNNDSNNNTNNSDNTDNINNAKYEKIGKGSYSKIYKYCNRVFKCNHSNRSNNTFLISDNYGVQYFKEILYNKLLCDIESPLVQAMNIFVLDDDVIIEMEEMEDTAWNYMKTIDLDLNDKVKRYDHNLNVKRKLKKNIINSNNSDALNNELTKTKLKLDKILLQIDDCYDYIRRVNLIVMYDIIKCIEHMHSYRIMHCDIKPSNVLYYCDDTNIQFKLCDLNLGYVMMNEAVYPWRKCFGTFTYISKDESLNITSDIYMLGATMVDLNVIRDSRLKCIDLASFVSVANHPSVFERFGHKLYQIICLMLTPKYRNRCYINDIKELLRIDEDNFINDNMYAVKYIKNKLGDFNDNFERIRHEFMNRIKLKSKSTVPIIDLRVNVNNLDPINNTTNSELDENTLVFDTYHKLHNTMNQPYEVITIINNISEAILTDKYTIYETFLLAISILRTHNQSPLKVCKKIKKKAEDEDVLINIKNLSLKYILDNNVQIY